jgi:hypothetical protein
MKTNKLVVAAVLATAIGAPIAGFIEFLGPGVEAFAFTFG